MAAGGQHAAKQRAGAPPLLLLLRAWPCCVAVAVLLGWQVARLRSWQLEQQQLLQGGPAAPGAAAPLAGGTSWPPVRLAYGLWWHAPFYSGTGYGSEAISFVSALHGRLSRQDLWLSASGDHIRAGVEASLEPATLQLLQDQEYNALVRSMPQELQRPAIAMCHTFPQCWALAGDADGSSAVPGCPCPAPEASDLVIYRVGRSMFETAGLPQHLVQHCNAMDEVWVPTEFNRATFQAAGVAPHKLRVVPQAVDAAAFDPARHEPLPGGLRALPGTQLLTGEPAGANIEGSSKPYVFLSVFKWEARKGWDVLLQAFLAEFGGARGSAAAELHLVTKPFGQAQSAQQPRAFREQLLAWLQRRLGLPAPGGGALPRVYLHSGHLDDATYPRLYASADCVVLPTRGEGWGRPQMEAMALAKPVITTNWSGPTAYISDATAYPLAIEGLAAAEQDMRDTALGGDPNGGVDPHFAGQLWAAPSVPHLRRLMRHVVTHPEEAAAKGAAARAHIVQHFAPDALADLVLAEVLRIQQQLGLNHTITPAPQRSAARSQTALCRAYAHLCKQGPAGIAEASKRAQAAFTNFRGRGSDANALLPGAMTVHELLALQAGASG